MKKTRRIVVTHRLHISSATRKRYTKIIALPRFAKIYMAISLAVLLVTTLFWSILGARVQQGNADQIVDASLFGSAATFHGASFPDTHSYLLKWPIFFLINVFGSSAATFMVFTVGCVLVTVLFLATFLYKIERRPLVFGTICLALASVLLLIPAEPYAGAILPVNMAMITTRNLEYILYMVSLVLLLRSSKIRSWSFGLGTACMGVLIASDKLFLAFNLGGALLVLIVYARYRRWSHVGSAVNWLILGVIATIVGSGILALINSSSLTHISNQATVIPYGLSGSAHNIVIGTLYAVLGLLTNFGANPAFNAKLVKSIPHQVIVNMVSTSGLAYIINLGILIFGLIVTFQIIKKSLLQKGNSKSGINKASLLTIILSATTIIAVVSFIVTNHYYVVDARYLAISLFTIFVGLATYTRSKRRWRAEQLVCIGGVLLVGVILGMFGAAHGYSDDMSALKDQKNRNNLVAEVLTQHPVHTLVGDYWRVLPIRLSSHDKVNVTPLSSCTQSQHVLSSTTWQPNLYHTNFAYLLSFDGSLTNYPSCTINQVIGTYGRPNDSTLIAGTLSHPKELLLFYDQGIHKPSPNHPELTREPTTVLPIIPSALPNTACSGPSSMNIVAHQDDDILFMNPDIQRNITAGYCVRSVYVTAGDDGGDKYYWLSRERGSEAAYAHMVGVPDVWVQRTVELSDHEFIEVANIRGNPKISLLFMNLPDGNLQGQGFSASNFESLEKLKLGSISIIHTVDGQSYYSSAQLITAIATLLDIYQPTLIRTQASYASVKFPDHSDHISVGWYVKQAYAQYERLKYANQIIIPLQFYIGYPIHGMPANVSGAALSQKVATFLIYAKYDSHVCQSVQACRQTPTYNAYLTREYQNAY